MHLLTKYQSNWGCQHTLYDIGKNSFQMLCVRLRVRVDGGERAVIRYNWREGLVCKTAGARIGPVEVDGNLRFIGVEAGGNEWVEIGYRPHWSGIEPNFDGRFHH